MPIINFLRENAKNFYDEVCLVEIAPKTDENIRLRKTWKNFALIETGNENELRSEMTWGDFNERSNQFANFLLSRGAKKGDKVAILLMNCLEWLPIYFGILKAGCLAVPLNYRYTAEEIRYCVNLADCSIMLFGPEFIGRVEEVVEDMPKVKNLFYVGEDCPGYCESYELVKYCIKDDPMIPLTDDDLAAIYFSSGTTGFPKAILHAHRSLMQAAITEQAHHHQTHDDVFLCIPPFYHTGAKMHWFGSLVSGSRAVILKGVKPEWIIKTVAIEKCTIVWLLVPWAQDILDAIDSKEINLEDFDLSMWRLMHIGAQPVPPSLIKRWKQKFPHHEYDTNYGLSESIGPGCVHLGVKNIDKVGAIGKAGFGWETKVVDEDGNIVAQGEVGELCVRGNGVMLCYYKDPKATEEVLKDGWLYTGDMAEVDKDGFIYLVDRKKDVIISGGENLYPVQIENFLRKHNKIKDVAVIGVPDARLGEAAAAIIEVKENEEMTEVEVNEFCLDLPRYKRPRVIIFRDVPRNPTGKIEKPKLRQIYCGGSLVAKQNEI